jgi:23S rRNA (cytidine1920-2'-O)/16S rRNA (cytidine1409-2'-O)-methyltransferase
MTMGRKRLDQLIVERSILPNRSKARDAILRGAVTVGGTSATKPGQLVADDIEIVFDADPAYASRAGLKLAHALDHFQIEPSGYICLDIGASTGGFTDVLLQRGATRVTAIDVGHRQLHETLRRDPRVTVIEGLNARDLTAEHIPQPPDLIVCDVSFISLKLALPAALALAASEAGLVALIKPQFEVGRQNLGKGGIVRDPTLHLEVCDDITAWLEQHSGWSLSGVVPSPLQGSGGNREFLLCARCQTDASALNEA